MTKIAFITGITGQDGSYLAELLLEKGYDIHGIVRRTSLLYSHTRLDAFRNRINLKYGDMTDGSSLQNYIHTMVFDPNLEILEIYNLAAQSHVKISFDIPEYTTMVDGVGTLKLLEIIHSLPHELMKKVKYYQAGTSEMYGDVKENPQNESTPFNPVSPYACAKLYAHFITKNYRDAYGIYACNGILFNHESPRRGKNFVTMKIIDGIKQIMKGEDYCIKLGNIDSRRDWGHAKDYVEGMWLMMQQEKPDDFVLATGKTHSVRAFIEKAFEIIGISIKWENSGLDEIARDANTSQILVSIDEKYFRPCEVEVLLGDPTKAKEKLGWECKYNLEGIITDMLFDDTE